MSRKELRVIIGISDFVGYILDLTTSGSQPMFSADKNAIIVFNGEIYNFVELRLRLIKDGLRFNSSGDTEVLLQWLKKYGSKGLKHLNGMFSLAFLDIKEKKLLLARDRLGKKPLTEFPIKGNKIFFSSELKSLLKLDKGPKNINDQSVEQYFCYNYIPGKNTIYKNIHKLEPGSYIEFNERNISNAKSRAFWRIEYKPNYNITVDEWCDKIDFLINDSVKLRMQSDVEVGTFLSGGIDSSLISAIAKINSSNKNIFAFTIGFNETKWDESKFAGLLAKKYNLKHELIYFKPDLEETLSELVWHYEEPFADSSSIPTYHLCKAASNFGTVFLSGDGGDEIFAGYNRYMTVNKNNIIDNIPQRFRKRMQEIIDPYLPQFSNIRSKIMRSTLPKSKDKFIIILRTLVILLIIIF